ncbi:MAG: hypothetical protein AB1333_04230 [Patescibacteria group bacterium]
MAIPTLGQGNQVTNLILQSGITSENLQVILQNGSLSDLLKSNPKSIDRIQLRKILHLDGYPIAVDRTKSPVEAWKSTGAIDSHKMEAIPSKTYEEFYEEVICEPDRTNFFYKDLENCVEGHIFRKHSRVEKLGNKKEETIFLLSFDHSVEDYQTRIRKMGYRTADFWEFCSFLEQYPDIMNELPNGANLMTLGNMDIDGKRYYLSSRIDKSLDYSPDRRRLFCELEYLMQRCTKNKIFFVVIKK